VSCGLGRPLCSRSYVAKNVNVAQFKVSFWDYFTLTVSTLLWFNSVFEFRIEFFSIHVLHIFVLVTCAYMRVYIHTHILTLTHTHKHTLAHTLAHICPSSGPGPVAM